MVGVRDKKNPALNKLSMLTLPSALLCAQAVATSTGGDSVAQAIAQASASGCGNASAVASVGLQPPTGTRLVDMKNQ